MNLKPKASFILSIRELNESDKIAFRELEGIHSISFNFSRQDGVDGQFSKCLKNN